MTRETLTQNLKMLFAAHHCVVHSKKIHNIARIVNVKPKTLEKWMRQETWRECLEFWGKSPKLGDLKFAEKLWVEMVENGEHLTPIKYPNEPLKAKQGNGNPEVDTLINSHLFCVDNLSGDEIRAKLAEDGNPVPYEGQYIRGYHYFVYPNAAEGLYSKVLARANGVGDLVIGDGEDRCLVIIRYGRLSLTRQVSDDIANVYDERLLVCL